LLQKGANQLVTEPQSDSKDDHEDSKHLQSQDLTSHSISRVEQTIRERNFFEKLQKDYLT